MSRVSRARQKAIGEEMGGEVTTSTDAIPWNLSDVSPADDPIPSIARTDGRLEPHPGPWDHTADSEVTRYLRGLVQRTFLSPGNDGTAIRSVLFCAVDGTPDASSVCRAASEALASLTAKTVCLLGAGSEAAPGLRTLVAPQSGPNAKRLARNLWLAPTGHLRTADGAEGRLVQLQASFDYLIVDAAAFADAADVWALGSLIDGVMLIVDEHVTRREVARRVADTLQAEGGRLLGVVLTNRSYPIPGPVYRRL